MKQLHTNDISMNNGKLFRKQMVENFEIIQQEDVKDDTNFTQEIKDRQDADNSLQKQIDKVNERLDKLDTEKATHDDVEKLRSELLGRIHHIYMGDDHQAIREVILDMKEKGEI